MSGFPWLPLLRVTALTIAGLYLLALVLLFIFQRAIIYFPRRASERDLLDLADQMDAEAWRNQRGELIGWKSKRRPGAPKAGNRLLAFHGNTGYALHRVHFIRGFERIDGGQQWEVYLFEYPGYGARAGRISEASITRTASAAVAELRAADSRPLFLLGESMGTGAACAMAREYGSAISGLLLITPYSRLADAAGYHYPWVPVRLLLLDRWDNMTALKEYRGRYATILAGHDQTTPTVQGEALYESVRGPKQLWMQAGAAHNAVNYALSAAWWREIASFLTEPPASPRP